MGHGHRRTLPWSAIAARRLRGELRGKRYRSAAVVAFYRRSDACPVLLEVLQLENSAHRTDVLRDGYGDLAFVKIAAPGAGQPSQRIGKPRDLEPAERGVRRRDGRHSRREPEFAGYGIACQFARQSRDFERQIPVDRDSLLGQIDRRLQDRRERLRAEALERKAQAVDLAGQRKRQRPVDVAVFPDRRPGEKVARESAAQGEIGGVERARGDRAEVDYLDAVFLREVDEHVADSAEAAVPRLDGGEREASGDGGVDRIAPRGEYLRADLGGEAVLRGDDAASRARRGLPHVPILRPVVETGIRAGISHLRT